MKNQAKIFNKLSAIVNFVMLLSFTISVLSCKKNPKNDDDHKNPLALGPGFYVVNEGNYTFGNATLSYYQADSNRILQNVFFVRNNVPLGDVAQSMTFWKKDAFIVVNNSGIIWKIDAETAEIKEKVSGLSSPRHLLILNENKAYISDIQEEGVLILNMENLEISGFVHTRKTTEQMLLLNGELIVANWSKYNQTAENNSIQIIDTETDQLVDSVIVSKEPNSMVIDKNQKLWVLCSGGYMNEEYPALYRINAENRQIERRFEFASKLVSPEQLVINTAKDTLYFLNNGIWRMSVDDEALPQTVFIPSAKRNYYRLAVDPLNWQLMATDAGNFQQKGYVFRFKTDGTLIDSLSTGVAPGFIGFNTNP